MLFVLATAGCGTVSYLIQAGVGQLDISSRTRPIGEVTKDESVSPRIRGLLAEVATIKRFGETEGLTPTKNYVRYADLERNQAVWVLSASEPLAFKSQTWWFPITGRIPYLGYFSRGDADQMASYLADQGLDVDVRGAEAYSTIGWFEDPVLSTMISSGDDAIGDLADVVLHESVHATVYVPGQAGLNESVASYISDKLTPVYLQSTRGKKSKEEVAWVSGQDRFEKRQKIMHAAYDELDKLYKSSAPPEEKLAKKKAIFDKLMLETHARRRLNNATLAELKTYNSGTKELDELLAACGNDFPRLIASLKTLEFNDFRGAVDRDLGRVIGQLARKGCPLSKAPALADAGRVPRAR